MRYFLSILFLVGCSGVQSVREPFVTIDENNDPHVYHTIESPTQVETPELLGVDTSYQIEEEAASVKTNMSKQVVRVWDDWFVTIFFGVGVVGLLIYSEFFYKPR